MDFRHRLKTLAIVFERSNSSVHREEAQEIYSTFKKYADEIEDLAYGPIQLVHGDPKISNLLFENVGDEAVCFVDLDTLAFMPVSLELGDAMRSWCNPRLEDDPRAHFNLDFFKNALQSYVSHRGRGCTQKVVRLVVGSTIRIYLDLVARFLIDAMEESYFGWDSIKYASRGEHNLARARGQMSAMVSLCKKREEAEQIAVDCFP